MPLRLSPQSETLARQFANRFLSCQLHHRSEAAMALEAKALAAQVRIAGGLIETVAAARKAGQIVFE